MRKNRKLGHGFMKHALWQHELTTEFMILFVNYFLYFTDTNSNQNHKIMKWKDMRSRFRWCSASTVPSASLFLTSNHTQNHLWVPLTFKNRHATLKSHSSIRNYRSMVFNFPLGFYQLSFRDSFASPWQGRRQYTALEQVAKFSWFWGAIKPGFRPAARRKSVWWRQV